MGLRFLRSTVLTDIFGLPFPGGGASVPGVRTGVLHAADEMNVVASVVCLFMISFARSDKEKLIKVC